MARGQKSFYYLKKTPVNDDEIYMMFMMNIYQHKSLEYLVRKFKDSTSDTKEFIIKVDLVAPVISAIDGINIFI